MGPARVQPGRRADAAVRRSRWRTVRHVRGRGRRRNARTGRLAADHRHRAISGSAAGRAGRCDRRCSWSGFAVPTSTPNGRPSRSRSCRATCRGSASSSTRSAAPCSTTTCGPRSPWPPQVAAGQATAAGPGDLAGELQRHRPAVADDPGNADAAAAITARRRTRISAPILVGAVLEGPGTNARNASIVWLPGPTGGPQSGPHGTYVKQHPVPFAEYVPLRSIARLVSKQVDLVTHDFLAGRRRTGVLNMGGVRRSATRSASRSPTTTSCGTPSPAARSC